MVLRVCCNKRRALRFARSKVIRWPVFVRTDMGKYLSQEGEAESLRDLLVQARAAWTVAPGAEVRKPLGQVIDAHWFPYREWSS